MKVFFGLGNYSKEYLGNRHNVGFFFIDKLVEVFDLNCVGKKLHGEIFSGNVFGHDILAIKPTCFMNDSGKCVNSVKNFYKILNQDMMVVYDELDCDLGFAKMKYNVSANGHNGIRSIDMLMGAKDYFKLKIGIGRPEKDTVSNFVLSDFLDHERLQVDKVINKITSNFSHILNTNPENYNKSLSFLNAI